MKKATAIPEFTDKKTGEISKLNEVKLVITKQGRRVRIQQNFDACPSMAEQHTAHLTNINYLMEKYKPDELAAYIAARSQYKKEIVNHDFSKEPSLQEARNVIYQSKQNFLSLPDDIRNHFSNHVEFLKFIDNEANAEKMVRLGILTRAEIKKIQIPESTQPVKTSDEPKK